GIRYRNVTVFQTCALPMSEVHDPGVSAVFVATGEVYADAMTGAPISVAIGGPIVLTKPDDLQEVTISELERLDPERIIVLGGTEIGEVRGAERGSVPLDGQ